MLSLPMLTPSRDAVVAALRPSGPVHGPSKPAARRLPLLRASPTALHAPFLALSWRKCRVMKFGCAYLVRVASRRPSRSSLYKESPSSSLTTENTESRVRAHRGGWGVRVFPPLQPLRIHLPLDGHPRASAAVLGFPLLADAPSPIRSPLRGRVGSCALQSPLFAPFIAAARSSL